MIANNEHQLQLEQELYEADFLLYFLIKLMRG